MLGCAISIVAARVLHAHVLVDKDRVMMCFSIFWPQAVHQGLRYKHNIALCKVCTMPCSQVVASADVFGIYQEGVQQHLDDAFANKGHPDVSPQVPQAAPGPFRNSSLAPSHSTSALGPPVSQPHPQPQPDPAPESTADLASVSVANPQLQDDPAAPAAAAAPAADHTAAELPEGPAQDAAAATATDGIPTAIVPTDNTVVVEAVTVPAAPDKMPDGNKRLPV